MAVAVSINLLAIQPIPLSGEFGAGNIFIGISKRVVKEFSTLLNLFKQVLYCNLQILPKVL